MLRLLIILYLQDKFTAHLTGAWSAPTPHSPMLTHCFPEVGFRCCVTRSWTWSSRWLYSKLTHRSKKHRVIILPNQQTDPSQCAHPGLGPLQRRWWSRLFWQQSAITAARCSLIPLVHGFLWRGKRFRFLPTCCRFSREAGVHVPILMKVSTKSPLVTIGKDLSSQTAFLITQMSEEEVTDLPPLECETGEWDVTESITN